MFLRVREFHAEKLSPVEIRADKMVHPAQNSIGTMDALIEDNGDVRFAPADGVECHRVVDAHLGAELVRFAHPTANVGLH